MEPTLCQPPAPKQPEGHWLIRASRALLLERRLPTRFITGWHRLWIALGRPYRIISVNGLRLKVRRLTADEHFLRDIILEESYSPAGYEIGPQEAVIDVGGHIGTFAVFAASRAPQGRIITLEPCHESYDLLRQNIALNRLNHVTAVRAALSTSRGQTTLYLHPQGAGCHSTSADQAPSKDAFETVETLTLSDVMADYGLDHCHFLKFNCEGAEFPILYNAPREVLQRVEKLLVQYHASSVSEKRQQADGLVGYLQRQGYRIDYYTDEVGTVRGTIFAKRR